VTNPLQDLSERIQVELTELSQVLSRVEEGWKRSSRSGDDFYLDSVALNLHSFYSSLERIFEKIAEIVDGEIPKGENWHQALLVQMTKEIPGIRPAVISNSTYQKLDGYRGFRHVVRNIYTFQFDPVKIEKLVDELPDTFDQIKTELLAFANLLSSASD